MQGAGILVLPGTVLTCAHVVASASAAGQGQGRPDAPPPGPVRIDVPGHAGSAAGEAVVAADAWFPGPLAGGSGVDLAVLHTAWTPPDGTTVARAGPCGEPDRREVHVYGFPAGAPEGLWSRARLVGRGGPHRDWIQLEGIGTGGARIGRGFSGAGVWDPVARHVVGMITAAYTDPQTRAAWMLPLEAAARRWPALTAALESPTSPGERSSPPSDRDQFALADALLNIALVEEDDGATLRSLLPPRIRRSVRTHARPRLQLFFLVQACVQHPDGRRALVESVRLLDDESQPARAVLDLVEKLWPTVQGGGSS
ncbi:trypsin-like peptidase domain-containing protein [Streptomyces sp. NPDC090106]|uniref:effector-associated domain 2-containing protein n=1 Tax=Streptomyces sp. NPDC090106 TaxID=3365946 RepID=UPI00381259FB